MKLAGVGVAVLSLFLEAERPDMNDIVVVRERIERALLKQLVQRFFGDMVKLVVDVRRGLIAAGGELHADAEEALLEDGSRQEDLWGVNYYPALGRERCLEFSALINIRPSQGNFGMEVENEGLRRKITDLVFRLIGEGEAL